MAQLIIARRYRGPAHSGNGGWVSGALAMHLADADTVRVRLLRPPPLEVPLTVETDADHVVLRHGEMVVAQASAVSDQPLTPVPSVDLDTATAASAAYPGFAQHPFPGCFSCGPERSEGLRIFPGPAAPGGTAAPWLCQQDDVPATWAALDCIGGWAAGIEDRPMVLGQITATLMAAPETGQVHVVTGQSRGQEGRRHFTASSLYDAQGRLLGIAEHVWVEVDPAAFNTLKEES